MRTVKRVLFQQGWDGDASAVVGAMVVDDATALVLQTGAEDNSLSCSFTDGTDAPPTALVIRARRLDNGVPSGNGTPPELSVQVLAKAEKVAAGVIKPGRFWCDHVVPLPAGSESTSLSAVLVAAAVDRQVAISRLAIDQAPEALPPAEPLPAAPLEAIDFQAMTKAQIVQHCSTAYGVDLDSSQTKAALIEQAAALVGQAWNENGN
jgi:hypothetical protein